MCKFRKGKLCFVLSDYHAVELAGDRVYGTCPDCDHTVYISRWSVAPCMFKSKLEMRKTSFLDVTHSRRDCRLCVGVHFSPILLD